MNSPDSKPKGPGIMVVQHPDSRVAMHSQAIGFRAWAGELLQRRWRNTEDLLVVYQHPETQGFPKAKKDAEILKSWQELEAEGRFVNVLTYLSEAALYGSGSEDAAIPVGSAWAVELGRYPFYKRIGRGDDPRSHYAEVMIGEFNVIPEAQGRGVGTAQLNELLRPFNPYAHPCVEVPKELRRAVKWLGRHGFVEMSSRKDYLFGKQTESIKLLNLKAPGVDIVRRSLQSRLKTTEAYRILDEYGQDVTEETLAAELDQAIN